MLQLGTLSFAEIHRAQPQAFVEDVMVRGGFPELYEKPEIDARGFYQSYVATYLERDLRFSNKWEVFAILSDSLRQRHFARPGC